MPEETRADFALTNAQRYSLTYSARCMRRWGWAGFWLQLALSLVSTGILFFSVAFTTTVRPAAERGVCSADRAVLGKRSHILTLTRAMH